MFKVLDMAPSDLTAIEIEGSVTQEDYQEVLLPVLESAKEAHSKLNLLILLKSGLTSFSPAAIWQDIKTGLSYTDCINRIALVSDNNWVNKLVHTLEAIFPFPVESFKSADLDKAKDWVCQKEKPKLHYRFDRDHGQLEVMVDNDLNPADFDKVADAIDPWIEEHGSLKGLILEADEFPGWESLRAMLKHYSFVRKHHNKIDKIAVVADGLTANSMPYFANLFVDAKIRHFPKGEISAAKEFIRAS